MQGTRERNTTNVAGGPPIDSKRARILACAREVFAVSGYEHASTNLIAQQAGVSKGLIFHYFGSKRDLYLRLLDDAVVTYNQRFYVDLDTLPRDFFDRMMAWSHRKITLAQEDPYLYALLSTAHMDVPKELVESINERRVKLTEEAWGRFMDGVQLTRLRPGIPQEKALEMVAVFLDGLERRYTIQFKDLLKQPEQAAIALAPIHQEVRMYLGALRDGLYEG